MTVDNRRILGLLGLAARAGQLKSGSDVCQQAIRRGTVAFALLDEAASQNTRDLFTSLCGTRNIPLYFLTQDDLGNAIGRPGRMIAVLQEGPLAARLQALLSGGS